MLQASLLEKLSVLHVIQKPRSCDTFVECGFMTVVNTSIFDTFATVAPDV